MASSARVLRRPHAPTALHTLGYTAIRSSPVAAAGKARRGLWTWGSSDHGKGGRGLDPVAPVFELQELLPVQVEAPSLKASQIRQVGEWSSGWLSVCLATPQ